MVLGVMEEEQEGKKTRRSWADDGKATIELLTHVPLGPVFSDMALRGWCFFCSEKMGGLCRLVVYQKVVMSDERLSTARVRGCYQIMERAGSPLGLQAVGKLPSSSPAH